MANTFKNAGIAVGNSATTLYTCPANTKAVIHSLFLSNIDGVNNVTATVEASIDGGSTYRHIIKLVDVPAKSTLVLDKPINLAASDVIRCTAGAAGDLEAVASILEIT